MKKVILGTGLIICGALVFSKIKISNIWVGRKHTVNGGGFTRILKEYELL